jgi:CRP/FNR family transcriptional regulator, cyclic AMP receptor protein
MIRRLSSDSAVRGLIREYERGQQIFKQGERGGSMYIVDSGYIRIMTKVGGIEQLVGIVPPGEVIGERGILHRTAYRRNFTAVAQTPTTLIELDSEALNILKTLVPDIELRVLHMVLDRLSKANELVSILQARDPMDRFAGYIRYFIKHYIELLPDDAELTVTGTELCVVANVPSELVEGCMKNLVKCKAARKVEHGYILPKLDMFDAHVSKMGIGVKLKTAA